MNLKSENKIIKTNILSVRDYIEAFSSNFSKSVLSSTIVPSTQ